MTRHTREPAYPDDNRTARKKIEGGIVFTRKKLRKNKLLGECRENHRGYPS